MAIDQGSQFGERLRLGRERKERLTGRPYTQADLARALAKSGNTVVGWESRGTIPPPHTRQQAAKELDVSVEWLEGATDDPTPGTGSSWVVRETEARRDPELPTRLQLMAVDFERWAIEQGADRAFMRYVRSSLHEPDFVALFAGGPDESMMNPEEAENEMRAHIDELKTMLRRRLKRAAAVSGKLAPKEE